MPGYLEKVSTASAFLLLVNCVFVCGASAFRSVRVQYCWSRFDGLVRHCLAKAAIMAKAAIIYNTFIANFNELKYV
jgi:hypothetical protein